MTDWEQGLRNEVEDSMMSWTGLLWKEFPIAEFPELDPSLLLSTLKIAGSEKQSLLFGRDGGVGLLSPCWSKRVIETVMKCA